MKKIILSFLFAFTVFLIPSHNADASSIPNIPTKMPKMSYDDYIMVYCESYCDYVGSSETFVVMSYLDGYLQLKSDYFSSGISEIFVLNSKNEWVLSNTGTNSLYLSDVVPVKSFNNKIFTDFYGSDFFLKIPDPIPDPIPEITQVDLMSVMEPILSLVGLVVSCLVSWMAFRKSWTWLLSQLRSL